jgi:DNA segregation ATPase FtsK/SpoIIIE, S-DNA-T family
MAYRSDEPPPLLPSSFRDAIHGWLKKMLGLLVLVACAAGGISLLTWSAADPSLTHATGAATRNLLGPIGAILSDLVMQLLGLAGVFALLPPSFWALQLVTAQRLTHLRSQLLLAPAAILLLAGAAAALPATAAWPLHHGYGGMLGDLGLGLMASVLARVNPHQSTAAAGLFYFAAGMTVLLGSLGLTRHDLKLIFQPNLSIKSRGYGDRLRRLLQLAGGLAASLLPRHDGVPRPRREPNFAPLPQPLAAQPPAWQPAAPAPMAPDLAPVAAEVVADVPAAEEEHAFAGGRDAAFDTITDRSSRAIAERFAPSRRRRTRPPAPDETVAIEEPPAPPPRRPARPDVHGVPSPCRRPPLSLLKRPPATRPPSDDMQRALLSEARALEGCLRDCGVAGSIAHIRPGPVVTLLEFEPLRSIKTARLGALADDVARAMRAASVRVSLLPGRSAIGIELPNARRARVHLRDVFESDAFRASDATLPLALGLDISGAPVFADLARLPHLLLAGAAGVGKSVAVNAMILSLLYRLSPDQCRLLLIDPKLALSVHDGIPHLLSPVVGDAHQAVAALDWMLAEAEARQRRLARLAVRDVDAFNAHLRRAHKRGEPAPGAEERDGAPMPHIVVVIDEFAELMFIGGKRMETAVQQLAPMAHAAGIHLILATQRATADVLTGTLKASMPARLCFRVASKLDSRAILGEQGGEQLLGQGDMLHRNGSGRIVRVHGPDVSDAEIRGVARFLREQGGPRAAACVGELGVHATPPLAGRD